MGAYRQVKHGSVQQMPEHGVPIGSLWQTALLMGRKIRESRTGQPHFPPVQVQESMHYTSVRVRMDVVCRTLHR